MKKVFSALIVGLAIVSMSGCGKFDRAEAHFTGYSKICIDHVQYIQFSSGASVQYDVHGNVVQCSK